MISTLPNSNGRKHHTSAEPDVLSFLDVNHNSYRRNSVNSSWTYRRTTGKCDLAITFWNDCLKDWRRSKPDSFDVDALNTEAILRIVEQRLQSLAEINEANEGNLDQQQQLLRDLAARKPTKNVHYILETIAGEIDHAVAPLRAKLQDLVNRSPFTCLEVIDTVQQTLRDLQYPVLDFTPQKRFINGIRVLPAIAHAKGLPAKVRERLTAALRKQCVSEFHLAFSALAMDCVIERHRQAVAELMPFLEELRGQQATFRRNAAAVQKQLDEQRSIAKKRSVKSRSSVILEIETPDPVQLLAGIRDSHRCADHGALVLLFADKLHLMLNETARQRHPLIRTPAALTELVTKLPYAAVAAGVTDTIDHLLGDLHTVYTAVRSFGVSRTAQELYDRAAPLCGLSSRDHIRLNVETHRDVIIRLPQPRGPEDGEIAEQLREAFRELHPVCQFIEDPLESEISVVRTLVAFPIGIEATNAALLHDYAESAHQGHHPHLFGLLADSPAGRHLPQLLALAQHKPQV
ncbi:MAG: hypothetical protein ABSE63_10080 [Thermoguttaceae bacterium]|jgi:hypothetical protein